MEGCGISLVKPSVHRAGTTSTVAIIENVFSGDFAHCVSELNRVKEMLSSYQKSFAE